MNHRTTLRRAAVLAGAATLTVTLAACGGSGGSGDAGHGGHQSADRTAAGDAAHNDADVTFATDMIPHHAQALEMAEMAESRPLDRPVRRLVRQIEAAQAPEIETMTGWLEDWGQEVPETDDPHGGHGADHSMPGMMSAEDMAGLEAASDAGFQEMWLAMMVEHHRGAIEMAKVEQREGEYPDAISLAKDIERAQAAEIATMRRLLR